MARLTDTTYLAFPLRIDADSGPRTAAREAHVRQQIEQTLFTAAGERVFRPDFGAGVKRLVFEPYTNALSEFTRKRLSATLSEVLRGEVDPRTLAIEVGTGADGNAADGQLEIRVGYRLATINRQVTHSFKGGGDG